MVGKLTTHVLDTAEGCPVDKMAIELWLLDPQLAEKTLLKTIYTNNDGRTDLPILAGEEFKVGVYELVFGVGEYFTRHLSDLLDPPFLGRVPIQFGIIVGS